MEKMSKEYLMLFNGVSNTIRDLEQTLCNLKSLQQIVEEMYIAGEENKGG